MSKNRIVFRDFSIKKRAIAARRRNREKDDREISEYNGELYYNMEKDYDAERLARSGQNSARRALYYRAIIKGDRRKKYQYGATRKIRVT